jgi:preprotein translocase subunit SecD
VTTLITSLVLFLFGTGPIKGFAVTLSAGIVISLFTALVITKMIFDYRKQYTILSI